MFQPVKATSRLVAAMEVPIPKTSFDLRIRVKDRQRGVS